MIAVIFEVEIESGQFDEYLVLSEQLKKELETIRGFISVERFRSVNQVDKYLSLSFWRDEAAVKEWHGNAVHKGAQMAGKTKLFSDFRLRVTSVLRDYAMEK